MSARTELLNEDQLAALEAMKAWVKDPEGDSFFVLRGYAGTGKTFTCRALADSIKGRILFTAPTNKATKVLRESLTDPGYRPECATIYSALGLVLEASGEIKELKSRKVAEGEEPIDLSSYAFIVVDEGSMVGTKLMPEIQRVAQAQGVKFLFMGDPAQLPPVKEITSPIWKLDCPSATLTKVMRYDNTILDLATRMRKVVDHPAPSVAIATAWDKDKDEGVQRLTTMDFEEEIVRFAQLGMFSEPDAAKAVAWRNVTVDKYNYMIRKILYGAEAVAPWLYEDRVIFTAPARDMADNPVASTDDEGRIERIVEQYHPLYGDFKTFALTIILDTNRLVTAHVLHPEHAGRFNAQKETMAAEARQNPKRWKFFWEFLEAFHSLRHAYAITAHRAQGSTYNTVFVDYRDILLNQNRQEAFRCLYVACTRAKQRLYLA